MANIKYKTRLGIYQDGFFDTAKQSNLKSYLEAQALSGQKNVIINNATGFLVNDQVILYAGDGSFESAVIQSITLGAGGSNVLAYGILSSQAGWAYTGGSTFSDGGIVSSKRVVQRNMNGSVVQSAYVSKSVNVISGRLNTFSVSVDVNCTGGNIDRTNISLYIDGVEKQRITPSSNGTYTLSGSYTPSTGTGTIMLYMTDNNGTNSAITYSWYSLTNTYAVDLITVTENLTNTYPEGSRIGKYLGYLDTTNNKFQRMVAPDTGTGADGAFVSSGPTTTWSTDKNFTSVVIQNGHTVYIQGNIVIKCQGLFDLQLGGKISAKGQGYAGGGPGNYYGCTGVSELGASICGYGAYQGNGSGGAGGYASGYSQSRSSGAGGGYGTVGNNGQTLNASPNNVPVGGLVKNTPQLSQFTMEYLMGGGGGGGGSPSGTNGSGGAGGGIIRIHAKNITVAGEIDCDGNPGTNGVVPGNYYTAGGGGGAGGTIFLQALQKLTVTGLVHSVGGIGGYGYASGGAVDNTGGTGGYGRIRFEAGKIVGLSTPDFATGYPNNMGGFSRYGWYFTDKVKPLNDVFFVNAHIRFYANVAVNPSGSVSSGQKVIGLSSLNASKFNSGMRAIIYENEKMEIVTVDVVGGSSITVLSNLQYSYTTSAVLVRVDVRAYGSLGASGLPESLQELELKEVVNLGTNNWQVEYAKAFNTTGLETDKVQFTGMVRLEGKDNDAVDVYAKDISWSYF